MKGYGWSRGSSDLIVLCFIDLLAILGCSVRCLKKPLLMSLDTGGLLIRWSIQLLIGLLYGCRLLGILVGSRYVFLLIQSD